MAKKYSHCKSITFKNDNNIFLKIGNNKVSTMISEVFSRETIGNIILSKLNNYMIENIRSGSMIVEELILNQPREEYANIMAA